jgi:hypothetical protein
MPRAPYSALAYLCIGGGRSCRARPRSSRRISQQLHLLLHADGARHPEATATANNDLRKCQHLQTCMCNWHFHWGLVKLHVEFKQPSTVCTMCRSGFPCSLAGGALGLVTCGCTPIEGGDDSMCTAHVPSTAKDLGCAGMLDETRIYPDALKRAQSQDTAALRAKLCNATLVCLPSLPTSLFLLSGPRCLAG